MPSLVTLGSAGYNPYNDTFARFAMQGLQMGLQVMQHKDNLAQRQSEQLSNQMSESTQNLYKGVEMQMRNKELEHRMENDRFNQMLDQQKFKFSQDSFWEKMAMDKNEIAYQREQDRTVENPYKQSITKGNELRNKEIEATWEDRVRASRIEVDQRAADLEAKRLSNRLGADTYDSAVTARRLEPITAAQGIVNNAIKQSVYDQDPSLPLKQAQADLAYTQSQTEANESRAKYYAGGGATRASAMATASELRTMISANSALGKDTKEADDAIGVLRGEVSSMERNLKGNLPDDIRKGYEAGIAERKAKIEELSGGSAGSRANKELVEQMVEQLIRQYNSVLALRGQPTIDASNMSREQKIDEVLKVDNIFRREDAQSSGMLPGSQQQLSPADAAAQERAAGQPINTPSKNPPTSIYSPLDFNSSKKN